MIKDFLDQQLTIGDSVILIAPKYRGLVIGRIYALTPTAARVVYMNTWNYSKPGYRSTILQSGAQLVKVKHDTSSLRSEEELQKIGREFVAQQIADQPITPEGKCKACFGLGGFGSVESQRFTECDVCHGTGNENTTK